MKYKIGEDVRVLASSGGVPHTLISGMVQAGEVFTIVAARQDENKKAAYYDDNGFVYPEQYLQPASAPYPNKQLSKTRLIDMLHDVYHMGISEGLNKAMAGPLSGTMLYKKLDDETIKKIFKSYEID